MGVSYLRDGVIVDVDDLVEVLGDHLGHLKQLLEVVLAVRDKVVECNGGQVADGNLVR